MHDLDPTPGSRDRLPKGPRERLEQAMDKLHGSDRDGVGELPRAGPDDDLDPPDDGPEPDFGPNPTPFEAVEEIEGVGELFTF